VAEACRALPRFFDFFQDNFSKNGHSNGGKSLVSDQKMGWSSMRARMFLIFPAIAFLLFVSGPHIALGNVGHGNGYTVILQRVYVDGDVSEEIVTEKAKAPAEILEKYKKWRLVRWNGNRFVFQSRVDDISPLLKANGYFGITEQGILTIFDGKPENARIIHSYYQIDVDKLESRKRQQLIKGIPVRTKDRYHRVLETFKPYSIYD
jgi:forespore regulator of the sigma-K checkpoint